MPGSRLFQPLKRPVWLGSALNGALTPDMSAGGGWFAGIFAANAAVTINNPIHIPGGCVEIYFYLAQNATGGASVTWGSQFAVPDTLMKMPQVRKAPNRATIIHFVKTNEGGTPQWMYAGGVGDEFYELITVGANFGVIGGGPEAPAAYVDGPSYNYANLVGGINASAAIGQWAQVASFPTLRPSAIRQVAGNGYVIAFETNGTVLLSQPAAGLPSGATIMFDGLRIRL